MNGLPDNLPQEAYPQQEEQQQQGYTPYINPLQSPNFNVVDKQLEVDSTLIKFKEFLMGIQSYNEQGEPIINKDLQLCNQLGANSLLAELNSGLCQQVTLAYYSADEVKQIAENFEHELADKLTTNGKKWAIDLQNKSVIADTIGAIFRGNLTRTINGATHKGITQISLVREQVIERAEPQHPNNERKGFFDMLGFKRRGN